MNEPAPNDLPAQGYHWAFTERPEKRHRRAEIVYVHRRGESCQVYAFDRSLPLAWHEIYSWGPPVDRGPTSGEIAQIEVFAPVRLFADERATGLPEQIPMSLHVQIHKEWARQHETSRSAQSVLEDGGFTFAQLCEFGPEDWMDALEPRAPGDHLPSAEEDQALALIQLIEARLVELEQHEYTEVFTGEAAALRSYGNKLARVVADADRAPLERRGLGARAGGGPTW